MNYDYNDVKRIANDKCDTLDILVFQMALDYKTLEWDIVFTNHDAPTWLSSYDSIPNSTGDHRWFWKDHVLSLKVGEIVQTDFRIIRRIH